MMFYWGNVKSERTQRTWDNVSELKYTCLLKREHINNAFENEYLLLRVTTFEITNFVYSLLFFSSKEIFINKIMRVDGNT